MKRGPSYKAFAFRTAIALSTILVLMPSPSHAVAPSVATFDVAVGVSIKPPGGVTGECAAELARPNTDGQTMQVLVKGTAQAVGLYSGPAIQCTIYQDPDLNLVYDTPRGGCGGGGILVVAVCARLVPSVPIAPFKICARASAVSITTGTTVTATGPGCPDFLGS